MSKYGIPDPIKEYTDEHEFWGKNIGDAEVTIEEIEYQGEEKISFQLSISLI
ncbi:hypothetical protein [uncultured Microbulbifer sp.]|uniref:hypothetical protein n=1 Tax=uncultured Microbulbifer sp. TaxID=348147 RepID=UPI002618CB23|nr:hypothetical protein [uncultured Microbulbifer sp.]